jgi:hypothetical protein
MANGRRGAAQRREQAESATQAGAVLPAGGNQAGASP